MQGKDPVRRERDGAAQRRPSRRFEEILASLPVAVYVTDAEGRINWCNDALARLLCSEREKLLGRSHLAFHGPEVARRLEELPPSDLAAGFETEMTRGDGARVPVEMSVTSPALEGEEEGRVVLLRDRSRREEEGLQGFLESAADATVVVDEEGRVVMVNALGERMFGYSGGEILGRSIEMLLPARFRDRHALHRAGYFRELRVRLMGASLDLFGLRKDGSEVPVEISLSPLHTERGVLVLGAIRDVTDRKRLEETLREREELFRKAFEDGPIAMAIVDLDFRFQQVNATLCRLLGCGEQELTGRTFVEVTHPDDVAKDVNLAEQVFRGEIPHYHIEKRYLKKTGETIWARLSATVVRDSEGSALYGLAMIEDISARKLAEESTRHEREKLKVTLRSIGDAVITTDTKGVVDFMNPVAEGLTGCPAEEAVGHPLEKVFQILHEQTKQPLENPVSSVLRPDRTIEMANHALLKARDGREVPIAKSAAPIEDEDGELYGAVVVFRDESERRRMEEELLRARKIESIGVLAGGIAHDFNNLLTVIRGNISLAGEDARSEEKRAEWLAQAENACEQATSLTQQLLTFSKGGAPVLRTVSIPELLRESTRFALRGSNVSAEKSIEDGLWPVDADAGQIHQVVHNLVLNAAQAMSGGGTVRVRARNVRLEEGDIASLAPGRYVEISIEDHGDGISRQLLHRIFDPYFTTKDEGSGLGLATVYGIVAKHEGSITVESKMGVGSTFRVYLSASAGTVERDEETDDTGRVRGGRILVMDDEETIRNLLHDMLTRLGYRVDSVRDGAEAIAAYISAKRAGRPYAAVILDLTVPGGMGGRDAVARLRDRDPKVRAIVSSGYSNDSVMADFREHGFSGVVEKPYSFQKLKRALQQVLRDDPR